MKLVKLLICLAAIGSLASIVNAQLQRLSGLINPGFGGL